MIIKDDYKEPNIFDEMQPKYMTLKQLKSIYTANSDIQTGTEATVAAAGQAFKQSLKETIFSGIPTVAGQLFYKAGEKIEEVGELWKNRFFDENNQVSPTGGEIFNGNEIIEIGKSLQETGRVNIRTANRNLQMLRDDFEKNRIPISREERDSVLFSVASQALDYPVQLGLAYLNPALSIGYMATRVLGGEAVEGLEKYKKEMGDISGFELKSGEELGLNVANAVVQSVWERAFGAPAQLKNFMNSKGMLKLFGRGFTEEFATENLQNLTDAVFDDFSGRLDKDETVASRLAQNFRDTVVAGMFGGTSGTAFAIHNRSKGIDDIANNLLGESVPDDEKRAVATAIYENGVNTLQGLITTELETSSSLRAHHGEVYQSMFDNVLKAVQDAKNIGAFASLDESELARYANTEAKRFADQVLAEATMRKKPVSEVFSASDVSYENGKLSLRINGVSTEVSASDIVDSLEQAVQLSTRQDGPNIAENSAVVDAVIIPAGSLPKFNKISELRDWLREQIKSIGDVEVKTTKSKVDFNSETAGRIVKNGRQNKNNLAYPMLKQIIENGQYEGFRAADEKHKGKVKGQDVYRTAFVYGTTPYSMLFEVDVPLNNGGNNYAGQRVSKIEIEPSATQVSSLLENLRDKSKSSSIKISLASLRNNVKLSGIKNDVLFQESLDIANQNAELDANNPAYEGETINIDGVERTVYNSNGDRIAMSEPALRNFYKWFGDSKVVDEQGRPLVVAHSTDAIFDAFDINKAGESGDAGWLGTGFYFFGDRSLDNQYGKYVMPVYLKIENPYYATYEEKSELADINDKTASDDFRDKLVDGGYDGVYYNADLNQEWVAFNPNQIKSTSNRGAYSESDNIYYQSAFHGTPHPELEGGSFKLEKIGTGENAQAHGYGLYYTASYDVADKRYRERLTKPYTWFISFGEVEFDKKTGKYKNAFNETTLEFEVYKDFKLDAGEDIDVLLKSYEQTRFLDNRTDEKIAIVNKYKDYFVNDDIHNFSDESMATGQVYEVDLPENPYLLDEQKKFSEQSDYVQEKLLEVFRSLSPEQAKKITGDEKTPVENMLRWQIGRDIYKNLATGMGSQKATSQLLEKYGIKGITYDGRQDGRCFVIFNPDDVKVIQKFYQDKSNPQGANASIELLGDKALISLFEKADAHSLPHELAHYWLDAMFKYVKSGNATPEYMERWNAIAKHLGIKPNQERLTRRQQEIWASGYETYLNTQVAPVPVIRGLFDDYNRWLQRVYRELKTNPTYTSNDGKKHTIRLSDEMIRVFNSMTTGEFIARPDVERMATKVTPKLEKAVVELETKGAEEIQKMENATTYPSTIIKPTKAIRGMVRGEADEDPDNSVNISSVAMRELGEAFGYQKKNLAEEYAKAEAWVRGNLARAKEVVYGKVAPDGLLSTAINIAYVREMENMGNYVEAQKATRVRSFEQTLRGQEISMERVTTDDALSMSYWTGKVLARKEHAVASRFFKNDIQALRKFIDKESKALAHEIKGKPEDEKKMIIAKKLQELSKQYGSTTLYQMNEDLPDTYDQLYIITRSLIEDSVGINITDEQTNEISSNVDRMKKMFENSASKNGNPSIETFKKLDEMNKLIDSYSPTNQGVVWSSIYGRSAMLASVKSPITNIVSNVENFITEKLARIGMNIINGQTNDNLVSSDRIKDYIKWNDDVYAASGYMPTITENIFEETPKTLGESRPHSQGKGIVRQVGRVAENLVFKQLMGRPDNFAKGLVFTDVAGNRATQIAYEEGLTGEGAVLRANELFDDAVLLNPQTEEGQQIRKQAMEAAHQTTYTQDSKLAQVALRIREVLNTVGGKNWKMGDMLMPFVRTPANVVSAGLDYAIGSVYTLYNVKEIIQNPKSDVSQKAIRSAVRNGEGVLLALLISAFLDEDDYIPEFANLSPKMREMVKLQGGVYNSIRLFGHWVSLDYFGTLGVPLAGIMKARQRENLFNSLFAYGQGTVEQLLKVPGFREAADVIGSIQEIGAYDKKPEEVWKEVFDWTTDQAYTRTVPAFVNDIGKFLDTYERETDREMLKRIQSKIPFLREQLPAKTSIATGGKVKSEGWKALLFGSRVSEDNDKRLVNEVEKLMKQENMPSVSDPTRYGKLKDLPIDKKNQARAYFNAQYAREVKKIMSKSGYNRMKPEEKKKAFDKVRRELTEKLKERYKLK